MASVYEHIRSGDWLRRDRLAGYPLVMLAITAAALAWVLAVNGGVLPNGSPFGSDFVSYWVAAREALAGRPETPYLAARFAAAQDALFGDGNYYAFFYPPHYLVYLLPFGALPYYAALAAWTGATLLAALAVITSIAGRTRTVVALTLAFPAVFLTLAHGQNAFLSAALFGGGLMLMPARPVMAGVLFGLLTFKPQLGILIPVALLAGGHWRMIVSATATAIAAAAVSAIVLGADVWGLFLAQGDQALATLREGIVGWNKMISTYAMLRLAGAADGVAMTVQAAVSLAAAATVALAWRKRSGMPHEIRCAMLLTGALLATPFGLNYDLFILAPAIAFIASHGLRAGFPPWRKSLLALAYLSPVLMLWLAAYSVPVAPIVLGLLLVHLSVTAHGREEASAAMPAQ